MVAFNEPNLSPALVAGRARLATLRARPPTPSQTEKSSALLTHKTRTQRTPAARARARVTRARAYRLFFFLPPFFFLAADFFFEPPPPPLFMRLGILPPPAQILAARFSMASVIL